MYKLVIYNQRTKDVFDVTSIANTIEHTTSILGQPGKLTFILEKDPNDLLQVCEGNLVTFVSVNEETKTQINIFKGYIFNLGTDSTEAYKITAYDQTRYLKNRDTLIISPKNKPMSIVDLFNEICDRNGVSQVNRRCAVMDCTYKLEQKLQNNKTYFEMLDEAIQETLQYSDKNQYFFIRDNFGVLELNELSLCKTNWVIGTGSLLTDYQYEVDIDKDTYNRIKIISDDSKKGLAIELIEQDVESIAQYGVLQDLIVANKMTDNQIKIYGKAYLDMKNRPIKSIRLDAIGIDNLNAGDGFVFKLNKLNIPAHYVYIISATHRYDSDNHTMSLEVSVVNEEKIVKVEKNVLLYEVVRGEWGNNPQRTIDLLNSGYTQAEVDALQLEINRYYTFAYEFMDGKWGPIKSNEMGQFYLTTKQRMDLQRLNVDVDLLELLLQSDDFKRNRIDISKENL